MENLKNLICTIEGEICHVQLNRPEALNALTPDIFVEFAKVLNHIEPKKDIRIVILSGVGRAFAAGADITYMKDLDPQGAIDFAKLTTVLLRKMELMDKVFIAALHGYCLGGGFEFALACDLRLAAKSTKFGFPETGLGVIPGYSGTQRLSRLAGVPRAKELILTGDKFDAERAYQLNLVNYIVEDNTHVEEAFALAQKILKNAPRAVAFGKECINIGGQLDMESGIAYETNLFGLCFATQDQTEGMTAFVEKRKPNFKNC